MTSARLLPAAADDGAGAGASCGSGGVAAAGAAVSFRAAIALTVAALEGNQVDVGVLFTSDAVIAARGFVLLADDKRLQLADNVVPVVRADLLSKAPADFKTRIVEAPKAQAAE